MKTYLFIFLTLCVVTPHVCSAYTTSAQEAVQIDETTALFSITFSFGLASRDVYLPIRAVREQAWGEEVNTIGFTIVEDKVPHSEAGSAAGVVISDAEVVGGELYRVPAGTRETFTFYVVMKTEPDDLEADYAVLVTDLPFYRGAEQEYQHLNPSELQYYQTPETEFNSSNPSKN
ncbi:MAG: hypothetical protein R3B69_00190 [Candidatus Paceibacterota bacterium]